MYNLNSLSTTCSKFDSKPPGPWHDGMMKDMQECNLVVFLTQHKKYLKQIFNEQNVTEDNQVQCTCRKLHQCWLPATTHSKILHSCCPGRRKETEALDVQTNFQKKIKLVCKNPPRLNHHQCMQQTV